MASTGSKQVWVFVFDFGGVLMDWNPHYLYDSFFPGEPQKVDAFLDEIGFNEWNLRQDAGYPFKDAVAEHSARFPQYAELIRAYDQRWEETVGGAMDDTVAVLSGLRAAGYPLYGLSNWSSEKFRLVRHRYPFFDWFDNILISGEVRVAKPDPKIFHMLLERAGRPAEQCVFVDDSLKNIGAAQEVGLKTIHFRSADQLIDELEKLGVSRETIETGVQ